jgi:hypothetical protein
VNLDTYKNLVTMISFVGENHVAYLLTLISNIPINFPLETWLIIYTEEVTKVHIILFRNADLEKIPK